MNKNQNVRRVLSLLFAMVMLVSMMVVGTVTASAAETTNVAKNANTGVEYTTLQGAIDDATAGDTVVLLKDITLGTYVQGASNAAITITKAITLDGNGKTFTSKAGRAINVNVAPVDGEIGTVEIKNLTIKQYAGRNSSDQKRCINIITNSVNLNVTNCDLSLVEHYYSGRTLTSYVAGINVATGPVANITVNGSTISTIYGVVNYGAGTTFNIKDSTIEDALYCAWINAETTINVENSDLSTKTDMGTNNLGVAFLAQANNVEVSVDAESTITVLPPVGEDGTATGGQAYAVYSSASATAPTEVNIEATVVKTNSTDPVVYLLNAEAKVLKDGEYVMYYTVEDAVEDIEPGDKIVGLNGTTADEINTALDNAGFKADENGNVATKGVAEVNGVKYETLAAAIANAPAGATIKLLADVNENVTISKALNINGAKTTEEAAKAGKDGRWNFTGTISFAGVNLKVEYVNFEDGRLTKTAGGGNFTLSYCEFNCPNVSGYFVNLKGNNVVSVDNCDVYGTLNGAFIQIANGTTKAVFSNMNLYGVYYGFRITYSNAVEMTNITIDANSAYGISDSNYGAGSGTDKTYTMTNCKFYSAKAIELVDRKTGYDTVFVFKGSNEMTNLTNNGEDHVYKLAEDATLTAPANLKVASGVTGMTAVNDGTKYFLVNNATIGAQLVLDATINVKLNVNFDLLSQSKVYVNDVELVGGLFTDIAAKQMADVYTVTVVYNGYTVGEATFSVKSIAEKTIAETDTHDDLLVALLNYGAEAQKSFDYNENNLANAGLNGATVENVDLANGTNNYTDPDNSYYGASVSLKNEIKFNFKFFADRVPGAAKAVITNGNTEIATVTTFGTDRKNNRDLIVVTVNVSAVNADDVLFCTFYDAAGNEITAAGDSVLSYCVRAWAGLTALKEADATNGTDNYAKQACGLEFYQALANYAVIASGYAKNN